MTQVGPEQKRLEVTLRRAWLWLFPAPALLCGCSQEPPDYWQGYVEGDYIYVSPAASGTLLERNVIRGDRVRRGAPLFRLEQEREIAIRDEARARLQGALASLEDLSKGKRSEELDVIRAQLAQAQETLALSRIQLQRQQALFAKKTVPRASLDEAQATFKRDQARVRELRAQFGNRPPFGPQRRDPGGTGGDGSGACSLGPDGLGYRSEDPTGFRRRPGRRHLFRTRRVGTGGPARGLIITTWKSQGTLLRPGRSIEHLGVGEQLELRCDHCPEVYESKSATSRRKRNTRHR